MLANVKFVVLIGVALACAAAEQKRKDEADGEVFEEKKVGQLKDPHSGQWGGSLLPHDETDKQEQGTPEDAYHTFILVFSWFCVVMAGVTLFVFLIVFLRSHGYRQLVDHFEEQLESQQQIDQVLHKQSDNNANAAV